MRYKRDRDRVPVASAESLTYRFNNFTRTSQDHSAESDAQGEAHPCV